MLVCNEGLVFPGITVLLSLTVFMLLVAEIMPATSDSVPLIGKSVTVRQLFRAQRKQDHSRHVSYQRPHSGT